MTDRERECIDHNRPPVSALFVGADTVLIAVLVVIEAANENVIEIVLTALWGTPRLVNGGHQGDNSTAILLLQPRLSETISAVTIELAIETSYGYDEGGVCHHWWKS